MPKHKVHHNGCSYYILTTDDPSFLGMPTNEGKARNRATPKPDRPKPLAEPVPETRGPARKRVTKRCGKVAQGPGKTGLVRVWARGRGKTRTVEVYESLAKSKA